MTPAQKAKTAKLDDLLKRIDAYLKDKPLAWPEDVFLHVPNHYKNWQSFDRAIKNARIRRKYQAQKGGKR